MFHDDANHSKITDLSIRGISADELYLHIYIKLIVRFMKQSCHLFNLPLMQVNLCSILPVMGGVLCVLCGQLFMGGGWHLHSSILPLCVQGG